MKIEKVNYQKAYVIGPYLQEKIGFEVSLDEGDSPEEAITTMKKLADKWHEENNPHLNLDLGFGPAQFAPPSTTPVINRAHERLLILIENATTTGDLKTLWDDVENLNIPAINDAYYVKYGKLSQ